MSAAIPVSVLLAALVVGAIIFESGSIFGKPATDQATATSTVLQTATPSNSASPTASAEGQSSAQVSVKSQDLIAADMLSTNTASRATCGVTGAANDITLINTGTAATSVTEVNITWAGDVNSFPISGTCTVEPAGDTGSTTSGNPISILFGPVSKLTVSAVTGEAYSVTIALGGGGVLFFIADWGSPTFSSQGQNSAQVSITAQNLVAADLLSTNSAAYPTCSVTGAADDLTLTNTGTAAASVTGVTITWAGAVNSFPISGTCVVAAAGDSGATNNGNPINILFTATNKLGTSAVAGQTYAGTVTLDNGAVLPFVGTFGTVDQTPGQTNSGTTTRTVTQTNYETVTQTVTTTITSTTSIYPVPQNVTVSLAPSGEFANYAISAGSYSSSGSLGNQQSFSISPVFQGETITVSITLSCPGSSGPTAIASLYVNGELVSHTSVACGGNTTGQLSYVL